MTTSGQTRSHSTPSSLTGRDVVLEGRARSIQGMSSRSAARERLRVRARRASRSTGQASARRRPPRRIADARIIAGSRVDGAPPSSALSSAASSAKAAQAPCAQVSDRSGSRRGRAWTSLRRGTAQPRLAASRTSSVSRASWAAKALAPTKAAAAQLRSSATTVARARGSARSGPREPRRSATRAQMRRWSSGVRIPAGGVMGSPFGGCRRGVRRWLRARRQARRRPECWRPRSVAAGPRGRRRAP